MTTDLTGFRIAHRPICFSCVHLGDEKGRMSCSAYPDEIPDKIVFGPATAHDTVQADQTGTAVFEKEPESLEEVEWLEPDAPSLSWCHACKHRQALTCKAYPKGIPHSWMHGFDKHDTVQPDQVGDFVYQLDPESIYA